MEMIQWKLFIQESQCYQVHKGPSSFRLTASLKIDDKLGLKYV